MTEPPDESRQSQTTEEGWDESVLVWNGIVTKIPAPGAAARLPRDGPVRDPASPDQEARCPTDVGRGPPAYGAFLAGREALGETADRMLGASVDCTCVRITRSADVAVGETPWSRAASGNTTLTCHFATTNSFALFNRRETAC